jgi:hypothetical protein
VRGSDTVTQNVVVSQSEISDFAAGANQLERLGFRAVSQANETEVRYAAEGISFVFYYRIDVVEPSEEWEVTNNGFYNLTSYTSGTNTVEYWWSGNWGLTITWTADPIPETTRILHDFFRRTVQ